MKFAAQLLRIATGGETHVVEVEVEIQSFLTSALVSSDRFTPELQSYSLNRRLGGPRKLSGRFGVPGTSLASVGIRTRIVQISARQRNMLYHHRPTHMWLYHQEECLKKGPRN